MNYGNSDKSQAVLYTIGCAKKTAREFFTTLKQNQIRRLIDVRLNNISQLAGFTKKKDLEYFLKEICDITYLHKTDFAPTKDMLDGYKKKEISWQVYEEKYLDLLAQREVSEKIGHDELNMSCLLCSEPKPDHCHRRLLAEYLRDAKSNVIIKHL